MGYTTEFQGGFKITPPLSPKDRLELTTFAETRHGAMDPFPGMPGLWCQWAPNKEGTELGWDGGEKFYRYVEWLQYLIENKLSPKGYTLKGKVKWIGEDKFHDQGTITVNANVVSVKGKPRG